MPTQATLVSPLDGTIVPLEKVPDPVFSEHMLGNGLAILPTSQTVFAPIDGTITNINAALHALVIKHDEMELLIHVGLESVSLKGEGFQMFVQKGQSVKAGQKLLSFDLDILSKKAASTLVLLVITSPADTTITPLADNTIKTGLPFFSVQTAHEGEGNSLSSTDVLESAPLILRSPNGLHARPAAILAAIAAEHPYLVEMCKGNQCADAKSIVSLMGLSLNYDDVVTFRAFGPKDKAALLLKRLEEAFQRTLGTVPEAENIPDDLQPHMHGICACSGLAQGKAFLLRASLFSFEENSNQPANEHEALEKAMAALSSQMEKRLAEEKNAVTRDILNAHLLLLKDPLLASTTYQIIEQGKTAAFAFNSAIRRSVDILKQTKNRFLMERIADLKDLRREVLCQLTGQQRRSLSIPPGSIVIADELLPSDVSALPDHTAGVLLAGSSPTAHTGILLRNRNIPSIVRAGKSVLNIAAQTNLLLDADQGQVVIDPTPQEQEMFAKRMSLVNEWVVQENARAQETASTQDGLRIYVDSNVANPNEAARAYAAGADGIGLVRTEFLFQNLPFAPSEQEQLKAYQQILDSFPGKTVTFRLLDAGGDKPMPFINIPPEDDPIVGIRGIRALAANEKFFRTQLRALLRLVPQERVRIMLPMVSFVEELVHFRKIFQQEAAVLGLSKIAQLGIMIEVPSAALLADQFAKHADFFSIGTNDLTQYTLAIDRNHKELSPLADALHPAVLQLIALTQKGASLHKKPVSVCGALANEPEAIPFLIGLGITHLSVSPGIISRTKSRVRKTNFHRCKQLVEEALQQTSAAAVRELAKKQMVP